MNRTLPAQNRQQVQATRQSAEDAPGDGKALFLVHEEGDQIHQQRDRRNEQHQHSCKERKRRASSRSQHHHQRKRQPRNEGQPQAGLAENHVAFPRDLEQQTHSGSFAGSAGFRFKERICLLSARHGEMSAPPRGKGPLGDARPKIFGQIRDRLNRLCGGPTLSWPPEGGTPPAG